MCKIGINLNMTTPIGTQITNIVGQYRLVGAINWVTFPITLSNPETPDINIFGNYELRVNVTNNNTDTSPWSNITTFTITSNCGGTPPPPSLRSFEMHPDAFDIWQDACDNPSHYSSTKYHDGIYYRPKTGDTVYRDIGGTTTYNGSNDWFSVSDGYDIVGSIEVDKYGKVTGSRNC